MKTLVVLIALVAVALAAPALFEEVSEDFKNTNTNVPEPFKRESSPLNGLPNNLPSTSQISEFGVSGRSFGLKKPIIIKKKHGYHVYRDSDEEQAESGEKCGKQVKVKLCDVKTEDTLRNMNIEDKSTPVTEEDMKQSIKLAKEAVENLQRDLKTVERKSVSKTPSWQHGHSESDAELHQDIEVAREALEHIHKNFGNLEPMSLHAKTLKEPETIKDTDFTIAKTEEQRLAQWKEAMDTIQKNVEIAKNIEDSFRAASEETGLLFSGDMKLDNNKHNFNKITDHNKRASEDAVTEQNNKVDPESCKVEHAHEKSRQKENTKTGSMVDDMTSSASTMSEKKLQDINNLGKSRDVSGQPTETTLIDKARKFDKSLENAPKEKDADLDTMTLQDLFLRDTLVSDSMKKRDEKERNTEHDLKENKLMLTESAGSVPVSANNMKSVEAEDMLIEQRRKAATNTDETVLQKSMKHDEHLKKTEIAKKEQPTIFNDQFSNTNKKEDKDQRLKQAQEVDTTMFVKSAEEVSSNMQKELHGNTQKHQNTVHKEHLEQHSAEAKMGSQEDLKQQTEMFTPTNNADKVQFHQQQQPFLHPEMRAADDLKNKQQHQFTNPSQTRWAEDKNMQGHMQMQSMKSADNIHSQTLDHVHTIQHPGHHHHLAHGMQHHNFDTTSGHGQHHPRFPDSMPQGKSADMDKQSYYMSMRDGSGSGLDNNQLRWKPTHESSRSAYGAAVAPVPAIPSSSDAVGVFPNANVGGCSIPLLLSCNPSVVSGSLAKTHPAPYSNPAYRAEDDFNFHIKRDVKKTQDNLSNQIHRTPAATNLKTSNVLVAKQLNNE